MSETKKITLGAGCFWCVEAIFADLRGVEKVVSGYSGGKIKNPTYREICSGLTEHAEVVQLDYNPQEISLEKILEVFFMTHDPTTLNRQGADVGTQYRSAIFYHDNEQRDTAAQVKEAIDASNAYPNPIVTEITPFSVFYPAEDYHQQYFEMNGEQPYCQMVVKPKLDKFHKAFADVAKTKTH